MNAPELDFDELDKAITGVLNDKETQNDVQHMASQSDATNISVSTSAPVTPTAAVEPTPVKSSLNNKTAAPPPALPRNRVQGRPSAAPAPSNPVRKSVPASMPAMRRGVIDIISPQNQRPGTKVALPINDIRSTPAPQSVASTAAPEERTLRWPPKKAEVPAKPTAGQVQADSHQAFETHQPATATHDDSFERFDVLSRSGFDFDNDENQPPVTLPVTPQDTTPELTQPDKKPETSPSPFLSDAKVKKRPLGSFASAVTPAAPAPTFAAKQSAPVDLHKGMPADPLLEDHYDDGAEPLASEQSSQSQKSVANEQPTQKTVAEAVSDNAGTGVQLDHLLAENPAPAPMAIAADQVSQASAAPQSGVMQSIPQQYKVTTDKGDQPTRPVFDTTEYHTPMAGTQPEKRSHLGWWIALIVIILIAIAGGLFIYFYGQQLGL